MLQTLGYYETLKQIFMSLSKLWFERILENMQTVVSL